MVLDHLGAAILALTNHGGLGGESVEKSFEPQAHINFLRHVSPTFKTIIIKT
jgi:hypothetical protein